MIHTVVKIDAHASVWVCLWYGRPFLFIHLIDFESAFIVLISQIRKNIDCFVLIYIFIMHRLWHWKPIAINYKNWEPLSSICQNWILNTRSLSHTICQDWCMSLFQHIWLHCICNRSHTIRLAVALYSGNQHLIETKWITNN